MSLMQPLILIVDDDAELSSMLVGNPPNFQ